MWRAPHGSVPFKLTTYLAKGTDAQVPAYKPSRFPHSNTRKASPRYNGSENAGWGGVGRASWPVLPMRWTFPPVTYFWRPMQPIYLSAYIHTYLVYTIFNGCDLIGTGTQLAIGIARVESVLANRHKCVRVGKPRGTWDGKQRPPRQLRNREASNDYISTYVVRPLAWGRVVGRVENGVVVCHSRPT